MSMTFVFSQNKVDFDYTIPSTAFGKDRKFYVHVHEDYYRDTMDAFGVVYVLDAQAAAFYNNAKSIIDYLVWSYQIMPLIVVGIHSDNRGSEFIPLNKSLAKDDPDNWGEAHKLTEHIEKEIFPVIEKDFRTNGFRAIIGHSRGGAFVANTIFGENKDLFNAYIAISPGMNYLDNQILDDAAKAISSETEFNKFYFCTYGSVGTLEKNFKPQVDFLDSLFKVHSNQSIVWEKMELLGKTHWTVVAPSVEAGITSMNRAYQVDQHLFEQFAANKDKSIRQQVEEFYATQQEKLKYTYPLRSFKLRYYGNQFTGMGLYPQALELYDLSLEKDKHDVRTYMNKAWAYRKQKDKTNAKKTYEQALQILELNEKGLSPERIEKRKKDIQEEIEDMAKED